MSLPVSWHIQSDWMGNAASNSWQCCCRSAAGRDSSALTGAAGREWLARLHDADGHVNVLAGLGPDPRERPGPAGGSLREHAAVAVADDVTRGKAATGGRVALDDETADVGNFAGHGLGIKFFFIFSLGGAACTSASWHIRGPGGCRGQLGLDASGAVGSRGMRRWRR